MDMSVSMSMSMDNSNPSMSMAMMEMEEEKQQGVLREEKSNAGDVDMGMGMGIALRGSINRLIGQHPNDQVLFLFCSVLFFSWFWTTGTHIFLSFLFSLFFIRDIFIRRCR